MASQLPPPDGSLIPQTIDLKNYGDGALRLKPDAAQKPFWVCPDHRIILESHSPVYKEAEALLIAIAEPVSRTRYLQEYQLTDYSLYAGASMGLRTNEILEAMDRFSKTELPPQVRQKIHDETSRYGKVKLVMRAQQMYIECRNQPEVLEELLRDPVLRELRPLLRLERMQLRVHGRQRRHYIGAIRFLPTSLVGSFDLYRRVELRYETMAGLKVVTRPAPMINLTSGGGGGSSSSGVGGGGGGGPSSSAERGCRVELRLRLQYLSEEDHKKLHNQLVLDSKDFDAANPVYDPSKASHEVFFAFASESDYVRFGEAVLPAIRRHAKATDETDDAALDRWKELGEAARVAAPAAAAATGGGGGGAAGTAGGGVGGAGDGADAEAEALAAAAAADEALRRRVEDADEGDVTRTSIAEFEVDPSKVMEVKARCRELRWPLLEEYDFRNDTANPELPIELKHDDNRIRDYQEQALSRVFGNHRARSGIIVLPCGSGKTLVGIVAACTVKRGTLVLCNSSVSVEQWYQQFLMWAQIDRSRVTRFTADSKEPLHSEACILISTYNMIGYTGHRSANARAMMADVSEREWGLVILDEVHVAPADTFLTCMTTRTRSRCKLGLTATLVREDGKIDVLNAQIGPKLFEANWLDLQARGYIATVSCAEVWCEMTPEFYREYLRASTAVGRLLYAMNPNKFRSCEYLMRFHEARGDKTIIFSDNVFALREYARRLERPWIDGEVKQNERMRILSQFKSGGAFSTVLISKVGDTSIDLPEANVIIQIASHFGARRQEAQRLGRILRPKARSGDAFNAFFYTLISRDTQEMFYSGKRQQFLVDQGYAFKVITELTDMQQAEGLALSSKKDQLDLLGLVLSQSEAALGRAEENDDNEIARSGGGEGDTADGSGLSRKRASMSELSGAGSSVYAEVHVGQSVGQARLVNDYQKKQKAAAKARAKEKEKEQGSGSR